MNRSPESEARRKVNQAKTWYARLVEKNRQAEADYREKISRLEAERDAVVEEESDPIVDRLEAAARAQGLVWL